VARAGADVSSADVDIPKAGVDTPGAGVDTGVGVDTAGAGADKPKVGVEDTPNGFGSNVVIPNALVVVFSPVDAAGAGAPNRLGAED